MGAFEYFFTFYSLVLGLSVVELVAGMARLVDARREVKLGWLTPMLALFVAINICGFWGQAWALFHNAPFNNVLPLLSLANAGVYYVGAYLVFPREMAGLTTLDDNYWADRRWILGSVLVSNLMSLALYLFLLPANPGAAPRGEFGVVIVLFFAALLTAIIAPRGRIAVIALVVLMLISLEQVSDYLIALFSAGGWPIEGYTTDTLQTGSP